MKISRVVILINPTKGHAKQTAAAPRAVLDRERVAQQWIETLPPQRHLYRRLADLRNLRPDLVIACGGDGTLLQAAHRFRGSPTESERCCPPNPAESDSIRQHQP